MGPVALVTVAFIMALLSSESSAMSYSTFRRGFTLPRLSRVLLQPSCWRWKAMDKCCPHFSTPAYFTYLCYRPFNEPTTDYLPKTRFGFIQWSFCKELLSSSRLSGVIQKSEMSQTSYKTANPIYYFTSKRHISLANA